MIMWGGFYRDLSVSLHAAQDARATARDAQYRIEAITRWADQSLMLCEAIWTLASEKLGLTDDDLVARINEIDMRDGKLDGRVHTAPDACAKCGRTSAKRFDRCMYCGEPRGKKPLSR